MNKKAIKFILKKSVFVFMQMLFSVVCFSGVSFPLGFSFALIRIFLNENIFLVTVNYFVSKAVLFGDLKILCITAFEIVVIALYYFTRNFWSIKRERIVLMLFVMLSKALSLYFSFLDLKSLILFLIGFGLEIFAGFYFFKFFTSTKQRMLFFKFSNFDYLCFSIMVFLLSLGLFDYPFISKYINLFALSFLIVVGNKFLPTEKFFIVSGMMALGAVVVSGNNFYLFFTMLLSLILVNFKDLNKWLYAVLVAVVFAVFVITFEFFAFISYFSLIFAVFCYLIVPNKWLFKLLQTFEVDSLEVVYENLEKERVDEIRRKFLGFSETLLQMQKNLKFLLVGKIDRKSACRELSQDVILKCCKNCENYRYCFTQNIDKKTMFEKLLFEAVERKQVSSENVVNGIQLYCSRSGVIVSEINQISKQYLSFEQAMKNEDDSKLLISEEIGNFANIFSNFAKMLKNTIKTNKNSSNLLKEALLNNFVDAKEVVSVENENGLVSVNVVAENTELLKKEMIDALERKVNNKMKLKNIIHLEYSGMSLATFVPKPKLKVEFAVSSKARDEKNGDNALISKIDDNKFFIALADGMGHGERANKISSMVLSVVRSMFEVGLDDELVIGSVNKLLLPAGLDNFTTLDALIVDLVKNEATFIKMGASVSVVKHSKTSELVSCASLPIGIVNNVLPTISKKQIIENDVIFLASDGIVDSFLSVENFKNFVNDAKIYDLQKYVDNVVFDAENLNTKHPDDMTIIAVKLLKNN